MKELFFETIDSTNAYLKRNYEDLDDLTFVRTDFQSKGKGRSDRRWTADKGKNLLFSILIKNKELIRKFESLSINSAYLVLKVLEGYGLHDLAIKWPNDVYVKDRKICGILLEAVSREEMECLIIGIGINVNEDCFDGEYLTEPTSMKIELKKDIDLEELKDKIYESLLNGLDQDHLEEIRKYDYLKGKKVLTMINSEKKEATVLGINDDSSLKIVTDDKEMDLHSGEISFHV